jgi:hypothetical protein
MERKYQLFNLAKSNIFTFILNNENTHNSNTNNGNSNNNYYSNYYSNINNN